MNKYNIPSENRYEIIRNSQDVIISISTILTNGKK